MFCACDEWDTDLFELSRNGDRKDRRDNNDGDEAPKQKLMEMLSYDKKKSSVGADMAAEISSGVRTYTSCAAAVKGNSAATNAKSRNIMTAF